MLRIRTSPLTPLLRTARGTVARIFPVLIVSALLASSCMAQEKPVGLLTPKAASATAKQITAAQLKNYLTFIASDEMEGRDTPSRGQNTAAKFIAFNLERWGLKPMGDNGTFFQQIALVRSVVDTAKSGGNLNETTLQYGDDFIATGTDGVVIDAPVVYVGNGWVFKSKNLNAYEGVDVKGKLLLVTGQGLPAGVRFTDLKGKPGDDWIDPATYAIQNGALGIVRITDATDDAAWKGFVSGFNRFGNGLRVEKFGEQRGRGRPTPFPTFYLAPKALDTLLHNESLTAADAEKQADSNAGGKAFDLAPTKRLKFHIVTNVERKTTQNIVAAAEGSDPILKKEYVAFGAHYDHIGMGVPDQNGDTIFNGADDDGSGTTALLTLAETIGKSPVRPRRSFLFVWHTGEEKGLWGSQYFTEYPTVPLTQIVTQLNIDMIGRSKPANDTNPADKDLSGANEVYVIGSNMMSSQLAKVSDEANQNYLKLNFNKRYDDLNDTNRFFYRSDHYNYAKHGIPIIFYFDGVHVDYHGRGDEVSKIDFTKMEKITRTVFVTAVTLADLPKRPVVDKKLQAE